MPFEPELAVVVDCGSCETSVDWVTRVEFWVSCEFLLAEKSYCDDDFHRSDDSAFHMTCSYDPDLDKQSIGHLSLQSQNEPLGW